MCCSCLLIHSNQMLSCKCARYVTTFVRGMGARRHLWELLSETSCGTFLAELGHPIGDCSFWHKTLQEEIGERAMRDPLEHGIHGSLHSIPQRKLNPYIRIHVRVDEKLRCCSTFSLAAQPFLLHAAAVMPAIATMYKRGRRFGMPVSLASNSVDTNA